jgi:hypothetical protein
MTCDGEVHSQPEPWHGEMVICQALRLLGSFRHWTGRELIPARGTLLQQAQTLFEAPFVVLAHGGGPDPILNYGNRAALALWQTDWSTFVRMPSRLTAEPQYRQERALLLAEVAARGFSEGYSGIRVSCTGRRFRIEQATVWNILDEAGMPAGQAAAFSSWSYLEPKANPCV